MVGSDRIDLALFPGRSLFCFSALRGHLEKASAN